MSAGLPFDRTQSALTITAKEQRGVVTAHFVGSAANEDADFLERYFCRYVLFKLKIEYGSCLFLSCLDEIQSLASGKSLLVFNVTKFDFCYSRCVKALLGFCQTCVDRPPIKFIISTQPWQATSLRAMVGFSPNCTLVTEDDVAGECPHPSTRTESENYFAPTGKGSIHDKLICGACGAVLSEVIEYFD